MKYLKFILGIIVLLMLIFIGKGLLTPSIYYESEVSVNKSIEESWAVMSDKETVSKWIEGISKTELISGTEGTVGAVSKIYMDNEGQEMVMEETITNIIDNELIAMTFTMDFMDMDYEMHLSEEEGSTKITTKSTTVGNGMMAKSILSFMKGTMIAQEEENLGKLKVAIDDNTKNYFPEPEPEVLPEIIEEI